MKLIKGSPEAKKFMAKIRAKKNINKKAPVKKLSGIKESNKLKKDLKAKKLRLTHGYTTVKRKLSGIHKDTKSHNVKISVVSGAKKYRSSLGAVVSIGSNKNIKINNVTGTSTLIEHRLLQVKSWQSIIEALRKDLKDKNTTASQKTEIKKDINNAKTFLNHKKRLLASDLKKIK